jgi:hypothetical protein
MYIHAYVYVHTCICVCATHTQTSRIHIQSKSHLGRIRAKTASLKRLAPTSSTRPTKSCSTVTLLSAFPCLCSRYFQESASTSPHKAVRAHDLGRGARVTVSGRCDTSFSACCRTWEYMYVCMYVCKVWAVVRVSL